MLNKKSPHRSMDLSYLKIPKNTSLRREAFKSVTTFFSVTQLFLQKSHLSYVSRDHVDIISKCKNNNRKAQNELFECYAPTMLSICKRYLPDHQRAEDAVIKGFKKVFDHLNSYSGEGSFEGWVKRIIVNECLMIIRKDKKYQSHVPIESKPYGHVMINDRLEYEDIIKLLDRLPHGYRTIFNLYAIEGYKHREIAELLGISINTSKSQLILARKKLKAMIIKKTTVNE